MTWWQTLLVATLPVLLTSAALIGQQHLNNKHAEVTDHRDRADARAQRLEDAHTQMLQALYVFWRPIEWWYRSATRGQADETVVEPDRSLEIVFHREPVDQAISLLTVVGDEDDVRLADAVQYEITQAAKLRSLCMEIDSRVTAGELRAQRDRVRTLRKAYGDAARSAASQQRDRWTHSTPAASRRRWRGTTSETLDS